MAVVDGDCRSKLLVAALLIFLGAIAAIIYFFYFYVRIVDYSVPHRTDVQPAYEQTESVMVTSVGIPLNRIRRTLEADVPRDLWSIDRKMDECISRKNIRILGKEIVRTPKIGCRVVGEVKRGPLRLRGAGDGVKITFPINAVVRAQDIGGIIKQETATGTAVVEIDAHFAIDRNWRGEADVDLTYRWRQQPGIDILGRRIKLTSRTDQELKSVVANIEKSIERQVRALDLRGDVEELWAQAFLIESLSRENPPAWLRLTPQSAGIGQFRANNGRFSASVLLRAKTEVIVGDKPAQPDRTPLGANEPIVGRSGFNASIPVLADYAEVEPVILRALKRLAEKGIERENLGELNVTFRDVTLYPTANGKIAVGINALIEPVGARTGDIWASAEGQIWLTGTPVAEANSQVVHIRDLEVFGDTNTISGDLLLRVMASEQVRAEIEKALVEDFAKDYAEIVDIARKAVASVQLGGTTLKLELNTINHGPVQVTGDGLFMVLRAKGRASASIH